MEVQRRILCDAGLFWHRVAKRLEERVDKAIEDGWTVESIEYQGWIRRGYVVFLSRPVEWQDVES